MQDVAGVFTAFLIAVVAVALFITKTTDTIRNLVDSAGKLPKFTWNVVPFVLSIGLMLGWPDKASALSVLAHSIPGIGNPDAFDGTVGALIMGGIVGGASSFWHEKLDQWSSAAKANRAKANVSTTTFTNTGR